MDRIPFPDMKYPLVAILRGLTPAETPAAIEALLEAGFRAIEIPLNSPEPFKSIEIAAKMAPTDALIGAGTVLTIADVERLDASGGRLFVSPNVDVPVLSAAVARKMVTLPGVFTPTEALAAAATGATGLKFFPAGALGPSGISAIRAVLPPDLLIAAVGGVSDENFGDYARIGVKAFGLGSSIYKVGMSAADISVRAKTTIAAYASVFEPEMTLLHEFSGRPLCTNNTYHGEGPTYDPATDTAWWFSISDCELHELHLASGKKTVHSLPFIASVLARVDDERQMIVSEHGLHLRTIATGALELVTPIEKDMPHMRSNDGRVHPSGALWYGTMTKTGDGRKGAGTIYHVARGKVTVLYPDVSIPNGICFSPDGTIGYFVDTMENIYFKVKLDPASGLPAGKPEVFADERGGPGGVDGSVCAADGSIWNARWGVGEVHHYAPDGTKIARYKLPPNQTTCPAFIGRSADRLMVTTAREDLDAEALKADPQAGYTYDLGIAVTGVFDPAYKL